MLPAKYQPYRSCGSGQKVILMLFAIYGHDSHLKFQILTILAILVLIYMQNIKFDRIR